MSHDIKPGQTVRAIRDTESAVGVHINKGVTVQVVAGSGGRLFVGSLAGSYRAALPVADFEPVPPAPLDPLRGTPYEGFGAERVTIPTAPLDPSKVKAGDTVTLRVDNDDLPSITVSGETHTTILGVYLGGWRIDRLPGYVTLTAHQPAHEPEPEWKPGTVADIVRDFDTDRAFRSSNGTWITAYAEVDDKRVDEVHPLVVIDPENPPTECICGGGR